MTLNLDLNKFSKKELQDEIAKCSDNTVFLIHELSKITAVYNKLLTRRFVRPIKLATAKRNMDEYEIAKKITDKYSRLLLDESNSRIQEDKKE